MFLSVCDCERLKHDHIRQVEQPALEVHLSSKWATGEKNVQNLGEAFAQLLRHGLYPVVADVGHRSNNDAAVPLSEAFTEYKYIPHTYLEQNAGHCQNILFSKLAKRPGDPKSPRRDKCIFGALITNRGAASGGSFESKIRLRFQTRAHVKGRAHSGGWFIIDIKRIRW